MLTRGLLIMILGVACGADPPLHYDNEWVVHMDGGPEEAQLLAVEHGYRYLGPLIGMQDMYMLEKLDHPTRSKRDAHHLTRRLVDDQRVIWAEQQQVRERDKRDYNYLDFAWDSPGADHYMTQVADSFEWMGRSKHSMSEDDYAHDEEEDSREAPGARQNNLVNNLVKGGFGLNNYRQNKKDSKRFNDPLWGADQWYLHRSTKAVRQKADLNVLRCYDHGVTGKDMRVVILDDGLEFTHPDIKPNYDASISYDINGNKPDPTPSNAQNAHGTRCAGEVAMLANNSMCGVGVAFNSIIGAVRMLDGKVNDRVEATSVGYAYDKVDIYSASWGPTDNGATLDGPGRMLRETFKRGIKEGRNGRGNIYVWAAGNGGPKGDSCCADGYVNSIYTVSIGSVTQHNHFPFYGEQCSAVFAVTYSSGGPGEQNIASIDLNGKCTNKHTGTSAAAPLAAAMIALALEVRPELTWRDVQHVIVKTARKHPLKNTKGWTTNGAGLPISRRYGFGLMDAYGMVLAARSWEFVPPAYNCTIDYDAKNVSLPISKLYDIKFEVKNCPQVKYLEHVELFTNVMTQRRGQLEMYLTSPTGEQVQMIFTRPNDRSSDGYKNWKIMSVLFWNESPEGEWTVQIRDNCRTCKPGYLGLFALTIHGTTDPPAYLRDPSLTNTDVTGHDPVRTPPHLQQLQNQQPQQPQQSQWPEPQQVQNEQQPQPSPMMMRSESHVTRMLENIFEHLF